ncbi:hypothetical protein Thiosp_00192 [Thiorhodovibrio litoralis]|nr:hypothetical protein Thiosp_00192 [Thiorhodovibrio litoralis]
MSIEISGHEAMAQFPYMATFISTSSNFGGTESMRRALPDQFGQPNGLDILGQRQAAFARTDHDELIELECIDGRPH